jgi:hypothetical protein
VAVAWLALAAFAAFMLFDLLQKPRLDSQADPAFAHDDAFGAICEPQGCRSGSDCCRQVPHALLNFEQHVVLR